MAFGRTHPPEVEAAVIKACLDSGNNNLSAKKARDLLEQGQLPTHPTAYNLPLATCQYYVKEEKQKRARLGLTKLAQGDPSHAVDQLARRILSASEKYLTALDKAKTHDQDEYAKVAQTLAKVRPLLVADPEANDKKPAKKRSPLTKQLADNANPDPDKPTSPSQTPLRDKSASGETQPDTGQEPELPTDDSSQVRSDARDSVASSVSEHGRHPSWLSAA